MERVLRWHERGILPNQGVNPCNLCFGMRPLGENDARLCCDVGFLFFKRVVLPAWLCLKITLQQCLVGLSELGGSSDFLAWLIPVDLLLNTLVHSLQMTWCGLVLARSSR